MKLEDERVGQCQSSSLHGMPSCWPLLGLLAFESAWFVCDRYSWLGLGDRKGVAPAMSATAAALVVTWYFCQAMVNLVRWHRFQFSLRWLLLLLMVVTLPAHWVMTCLNSAKQQQLAVAALQSCGAAIGFQSIGADGERQSEWPRDTWWNRCWGIDFFHDVDSVKNICGAMRIIDADTVHIAKLRQLRVAHLNLNGRHFSLPGKEPVFSDQGMRAFGDLQLLEEFYLYDSPHVTDAGLQPLLKLPQLRRLGLEHLPQLSDDGLKLLPHMGHLEHLTLGKLPRITDAGIAHLAQCERLRELNLSWIDVTDAGAAHLVGLKNLEKLQLDGTGVSDATLEKLAALPQLRELSLQSTAITDAGIPYLATLVRLESLSLDDTSITDKAATHLARLTNLRALSLGGTRLTDRGLKELRSLTQLQKLTLRDTSITDASLVDLMGFSELNELYIGDVQVSAVQLQELTQMPNLVTLFANGTSIDLPVRDDQD